MQKALNQEALSSVSLVLLSTLDEDIFFGKMSEFIADQFEGLNIYICKNSRDGETQIIAENGQSVKNGKIFKKGEGISGYVVRTKRAYYSNSVQRDPLMANQNIDKNVVSEICVPVISDNNVLGTINVQSLSEDKKFSEDDVEKVQNILAYLEKPIRNMKMYLLATQMNNELIQKIEDKEGDTQMRSTSSQNSFARRDSGVKIIGHSQAIRSILKIVEKVAQEDFPVLFEGEGGVGKKLFAQRIHNLSARRKSPCISLNCSAMSDSMIEQELFGSLDRKGLFELANGGTLILDEISHLSEKLQTRLLRTLTSGEVFTVDGERSFFVNVRIISTSRLSLEKLAQEGKFQEELLYRLNTISINVPSLRERKEDIKYLVEFFLNHNREKQNFKVMTTRAIDALNNYSWPGNIQELRSVIERTYILSEGKYIDEHDLPESIKNGKSSEVREEEEFSAMTLHELEKRHIIKSLRHLNGNKTKAAKSLGITVKTLYNKLHSYGIIGDESSDENASA